MNIKELERRTGITKQNIRFYEKKELLSPERNPVNDYREYTEADVERLQMIKIFRKLDVPIEDIKRLFREEVSMETVMERHMEHLQKQQEQVKASLEICKVLVHKELCSLDVDAVLQKMDALEKRGGYFMKILDDYKKVSKIEGKKKFQFVPDLFIESPEEFTQELFRYANENNLNLVITKESMYPVFEIDGVEYTAHRYVQRYGARVECTATHPELLDDEEIPEGRRKKLRLLYWSIGPVVIILTTFLLLLERGFTSGAVIAGVSQAIISIAFLRYYYNLR